MCCSGSGLGIQGGVEGIGRRAYRRPASTIGVQFKTSRVETMLCSRECMNVGYPKGPCQSSLIYGKNSVDTSALKHLYGNSLGKGVYVCMYACMYVCTVCTCTILHIDISIPLYLYTSIYLCVPMSVVSLHIYLYISIFVYLYIYKNKYVNMHENIDISTDLLDIWIQICEGFCRCDV